MTFKSTLEKIETSKLFERFLNENPGVELVAGFFVLDFFGNDRKESLDYKKDEKIFTFSLNELDEISFKEDELIKDSGKPPLTKIEKDIEIDTDELRGIVGTKMLDEGISSSLNKIIAVLQIHEGKQIWNLTCMLDGLQMLHVLIDSITGEIIIFERKSMMDFIKKK